MAGREHLHRGGGARDQPSLSEHVRVHHGVPVKPHELAEVDHHVLMTKAVEETAQLRQPLLERHLAALEAGWEPDARPGALALLAATAGLALSGALTATDPFARPVAALSGTQLVELHAELSEAVARSWSSAAPAGESAGSPLTATRWRTLWTMPRIAGVASCSTVWLSLRRPSAASVAF